MYHSFCFGIADKISLFASVSTSPSTVVANIVALRLYPL